MLSEAVAAPSKTATRPSRWTFAAVILISAFLLFQVQFIAAKYILPWFGGTAAVWTTCLLFFQVLLLGGYVYAHAISTRFAPVRQARLHIILLLSSATVLLVLAVVWRAPILPGADWRPQSEGWETLRILRILLVSVGLPFFLLSTTGPLLQRWYSALYPGASPYPLYAVSNIGSLAGLISYPVIFEPLLRMPLQAWIWTGGFFLFVAGCLVCSNAVRQIRVFAPLDLRLRIPLDASGASESLAIRTQAQWVFLALLPSVLLLATTNTICQEIAVIPFLWALPLSIYLVSFILCFGPRTWYVPGLFHLLLGVSAALLVIVTRWPDMPLLPNIAALAFVLFVCCMFCHGELYRRRPDASHLTAFYLCLALGGALGGVFVSLIAPHIFPGFWEFWLAVTACFILLPVLLFRDRDSWLARTEVWVPLAVVLFGWLVSVRINLTTLLPWQIWLVGILATGSLFYGVVVIVQRRGRVVEATTPATRITRIVLLTSVLLVSYMLVDYIYVLYHRKIWMARNFYGVLAVEDARKIPPFLQVHTLVHGRTLHGFQIDEPKLRRVPTLYYATPTGIGIAFRNHSRRLSPDPSQRNLKVGVIGLGIGTLSAYAQPGDNFRYYELNDAVTRLAEGEHGYFHFLELSPAPVTVVPGDGRISLERELQAGEPQEFDICVIDAFNSDAIPVHLLTKQAMELYLRHLHDEHSILAVHLTNRNVDLVPVVATLAEHFHLKMKHIITDRAGVVFDSEWMLLSRDADFFARPEVVASRGEIPPRRVPLWTDDYSNVFQLLR
jgi:hypothetical protein